jgi:hypothetical protein
MITAEECKRHLAECQALGSAPHLTIRRATAIMAICRAWFVLARELARYHAVVQAEDAPQRADHSHRAGDKRG